MPVHCAYGQSPTSLNLFSSLYFPHSTFPKYPFTIWPKYPSHPLLILGPSPLYWPKCPYPSQNPRSRQFGLFWYTPKTGQLSLVWHESPSWLWLVKKNQTQPKTETRIHQAMKKLQAKVLIHFHGQNHSWKDDTTLSKDCSR